jgi:hypothetical protein
VAVLEDQLRYAERRRRGEQVRQNRRRSRNRCADDEQQQRKANSDHQAVNERKPASESAHADLAAPASLAVADEDRSRAGLEIVLGEI